MTMRLQKNLTLASQSKIRADLLRGAGLDFEIRISLSLIHI